MFKNLKTNFQDIHYLRQTPSFALKSCLSICEFVYKIIINSKNFLYEKNILKEKKTNVFIICVGNLTTGGVGKTPIVACIANELSKHKRVAIISKGYGAKLSNKSPVVVKDNKGIKFNNGINCGDEAFQSAKNTSDNVIVITCKNRKKAIEYALIKYGIEVAIFDDGFSNRKIKKDKTIIVIDSKMRFGNNHLLPYGPLREPIKEIKRADEIILVDKDDKNFSDSLNWIEQFNKPTKICKMIPDEIYNMQTKAQVLNYEKAIAFCAIGQPQQFFDFAKKYYEIVETFAFCDHYKYSKNDIEKLINIAKQHKIHTFITTQKDETKLIELVKEISDYSFNVLKLKTEIR